MVEHYLYARINRVSRAEDVLIVQAFSMKVLQIRHSHTQVPELSRRDELNQGNLST